MCLLIRRWSVLNTFQSFHILFSCRTDLWLLPIWQHFSYNYPQPPRRYNPLFFRRFRRIHEEKAWTLQNQRMWSGYLRFWIPRIICCSLLQLFRFHRNQDILPLLHWKQYNREAFCKQSVLRRHNQVQDTEISGYIHRQQKLNLSFCSHQQVRLTSIRYFARSPHQLHNSCQVSFHGNVSSGPQNCQRSIFQGRRRQG